MRVVYLSGPMTGFPEYNFPEFNRVAIGLRRCGLQVINPAEIEQPDKSWEACMRRDIPELMRADTLALLKGWEFSRGARLEYHIARELGMEIVDAYSLDPYDEQYPRGEGPK